MKDSGLSPLITMHAYVCTQSSENSTEPLDEYEKYYVFIHI